MKSSAVCLATALELEQAAAKAGSDTTRKMLLQAAVKWRKLADEAPEIEALRETARSH